MSVDTIIKIKWIMKRGSSSPDHGRGQGNHRRHLGRQYASTFLTLQGKHRWADTNSPRPRQPFESSRKKSEKETEIIF